MNAMPTEYKGITFRSKLEAQVAVLLDELNANARYEPQCFDLGEGLLYLPDFFVPNNVGFADPSEHKMDKAMVYKGEIGARQFWVEVKGNFASNPKDEEKVLKFANAVLKPVFFDGKPILSEWVVENKILVIDELPPPEAFKKFWALKSWFLEKSQKQAAGAKTIRAWSFNFLQDRPIEGSAAGYYFDETAPFPCVNVEGNFCLASFQYDDLVCIDVERTLAAYEKAWNAFAYKPPQHTRRFYKGAPYEFKGGRWQRVLNGDE